jgi:type III pantothenate kinase
MSSKKIIAVDIGNTSIDFAWINNGKITRSKKIPTQTATKQSIVKIIKNFNGPIAVCSVVPKATHLFKGLKQKVYFAGGNLTIPIKSLYDKKNIGMDRLLGAYAAIRLFSQARLILDFGTAITLDFVSTKKVYQGGIILPGIGSTQRVLSKCALLPKKIIYKPSKRMIPKNTAESISKGIDKGFSCMVNKLIEDYKKSLGIQNSTRVVITGGEAPIILKHLEFEYIYEPFLVFKGMYMLLHCNPD